MHEHQKTLCKIEKLVDQLPYRYVKIEVAMKDQTLLLEKDKQTPCSNVNKKLQPRGWSLLTEY